MRVRTVDRLALAPDAPLDIGLHLGFLRWTPLTRLIDFSHASLAWLRQAMSAQTKTILEDCVEGGFCGACECEQRVGKGLATILSTACRTASIVDVAVGLKFFFPSRGDEVARFKKVYTIPGTAWR